MLGLSIRRSVYCWSGLCVLFVLLSTHTMAMAADVTALFQQARTIATQLRRDAVTMESYTRSNLSWQSHGAQISLIKEHINKAGSILSELQAARGDAKPWHQDTIDRITPVLKELASNTESIINHLNANSRLLKDPTYVQYVKSNSELSGELSTAVGNAVDYDNTRTKMEELQAKLGQ